MTDIVALDVASWRPALSPDAQDVAIRTLEGGGVLILPQLAFPLAADERRFLSPRWSDGRAKNISFDGGKPRALTPEGYTGLGIVAPDGKWAVVAGPDRKRYLYPLSGGEPTAVPGIDREDVVDQRSLDGRFLFVHRRGELPAKVFRLDISSGRKELWRALMPADAAGVPGISVSPTPSGEAYLYSYTRTLSDLYLVDSVK